MHKHLQSLIQSLHDGCLAISDGIQTMRTVEDTEKGLINKE